MGKRRFTWAVIYEKKENCLQTPAGGVTLFCGSHVQKQGGWVNLSFPSERTFLQSCPVMVRAEV